MGGTEIYYLDQHDRKQDMVEHDFILDNPEADALLNDCAVSRAKSVLTDEEIKTYIKKDYKL